MPGTGKSHLAQAIGRAAIHQGHRVLYREAHTLLEERADATLDGTRKTFFAELTAVPLLIIDDIGMRKLPHTAAEDLLEVIMRRYERASTRLTSNRPIDDWGTLLGDTAAVTALLDRLLHEALAYLAGRIPSKMCVSASIPVKGLVSTEGLSLLQATVFSPVGRAWIRKSHTSRTAPWPPRNVVVSRARGLTSGCASDTQMGTPTCNRQSRSFTSLPT